jgi:hypothetical protein
MLEALKSKAKKKKKKKLFQDLWFNNGLSSF